MKNARENYVWGALRIVVGLIFIWAFFDKVFGLGFATERGKAWIDGVSPTLGFLKFGTDGPFDSLFQSLSGSIFVDWLFMLGLLLIGLTLILGIGVRIAGYSGALLMLLMWSAHLPPEHHPFLDEHIVYILVLLGCVYANSGDYWGLGRFWSGTKAVKRYPCLK